MSNYNCDNGTEESPCYAGGSLIVLKKAKGRNGCGIDRVRIPKRFI